MESLAEKVQSPGPSGTSTASNPGASAPDSAPLKAFAFEGGAKCFAVEVVTSEKFPARDDDGFAVDPVTITGVEVLVVVLVVVFVEVAEVVVTGTWVVTGDVEEGGSDKAPGSRVGDDAVRVKTSTSKRSGLDHIRRWALFSEKGERDIVFVG